MKKDQLFRKVSLEKLASPERLDEVMEITDARGWIALSAVGLLLLTGIVWSIVGILPEKVAGSGILVRSGGVLEVVAAASGRVTDIPIAVGDSVSEGQVVAWVAQPELLDRYHEARENLRALRLEHDERMRFAQKDLALQRQSLEQRRLNLDQSIAADSVRLNDLAARLEAQEQLLTEGLVARPALLQTRQQFDLNKEKIRASENELSQIAVQELTLENRLDESRRSGELKIAQAESQVSQIERQLNAQSQITSPYTGRILEVMTEPGQIVQRGEPVLSLDLAGNAIQDLVAVLYVPSVHGKKVKPGMQIQIAPSTIAQEEFGMLLGRVTFASSFPATPKGMLRVLKNQQLVAGLSGTGAPYEVHAELIVDPETESQYRWTSSGGPPTKIQSGTVAVGYITVKTQKPISRILPVLRQWAGA